MESELKSGEQAELRLQMLGGLGVTLGGVPVRGFLSSKVQALLCYLAVTGRPHSRESLMALLWGDMPEDRASHGLRQALSNLQKLVGSHISTRPLVAFNGLAPHYIDTAAFSALYRQAETASVGARRKLRKAVEVYSGDFLDGFYVRDAPDFEEWAASQREHLRHMALDALHSLASYHSARGECGAAAEYLRRLLSLDPWREDAHRLLMLMLAYQGKPDASIAQYQACRRALFDAFGEEPSQETAALYRRIRAGEVEIPPPQPQLRNVRTQVEQPVGRSGDLARIESLLEDPSHRLLTLTGPGGVGKTRLALQVASDMSGDFEHGVFFAPLASIRDPAEVLGSIAEVLGIETPPGRSVQQSLRAALRDKQMLLVLDNFEQLLDAAAQVAGLIADVPSLRVLVTSRAGLRVRGERLYPVAPLAVPPVQDVAEADVVAVFPAAQLFSERARLARPDFSITDANARVVAEICNRLEGLPLALELAAARLNIMPVQALLARLSNRLGVLTGGPRDLPERQQTVKATIGWSYDLLSRPERDLFARLSLFVGGCTLEAVEAVCGTEEEEEWTTRQSEDLLESISELVNSSLVRCEATARGEERFSMLEMVREYAEARLAEMIQPGQQGEGSDGLSAAPRRHAEYYLSMVVAAKPELTGPEQNKWMDRLEVERDNLRAALAWACSETISPSPSRSAKIQNPNSKIAPGFEQSGRVLELALQAGSALGRFWLSRGHVGEGRRWLERLLACPAHASPGVRADALKSAAVLAFSEGDLAGSAVFCEEGLALYSLIDDELGRASLYNNLGNIKREQGAYEQAVAIYEQSMAIFRRLDDTLGIAIVLNNLGATAQHQGDFARALALYQESLALRRSAGDAVGIAYTLYRLAEAARDSGDLSGATSACEESLAVSRDSRDRNGIAMALLTLGTIRAAEGNDEEAQALLEESLQMFIDNADKWGMATAWRRLAAQARHRRDYSRSRELYQQSRALYSENGDRVAEAQVLADLGELDEAEAEADEL